MLKPKINAQKLVHLELLLYLCIRKRNKQQIKTQDPEGQRDYDSKSKVRAGVERENPDDSQHHDGE